ncbi:hypothetical protein ZIOFF_038601 [Zingiber officinale]|uniref:Neprosin PEP catalytic domain-containing protein n=1 Tax=Zingiber officinale TaxID=94328 RepID=A0A8J5L2E3_ZINOF|nr:hypothetical protein ZIOFF_038601 [Zingiber officinale]
MNSGGSQGRSLKKEEKSSIKTIQLKPSFLPNGLKLAKPKPATFYGFNDTCPSGTILIERSQKSDYFRSHPVDEKTESGDYFAIIETNTKGPNLFYGASARMTTHLFSLLPTQVSASSMYLFGGADGPRYELNVIEAGWHYSPNEYNDYVPRFFTYWTRDGYANSGCGNLRCPGFVRTTSSPIGPGSPIKDFSVYGGEEVSFSLQIYKLKPSFLPNGLKPTKPKPATFYGFNDTCPSGTILIERSQKSDYFRSHVHPVDDIADLGHHFAVFENNIAKLFHGASARMTTHQLPNLLPNQVSSSSIYLYGDTYGPRNETNVIQAGWHVAPTLYNDNIPRFFTLWTTDGYEKTGCVNLRCPGFVRTTSGPIGPGSTIEKFSVYKGEEMSFSLEIFKDPSTSNWWVLLQGGALGYYPKELLPKMDIGVDRIQMGGHVYSPTSEASPPMGSGHPYTEGRKKAAYFTQVQFIDRRHILFNLEPQFLTFVSDLPDYYGIGKYHLDVTDGYIFAYGGAGGFIK